MQSYRPPEWFDSNHTHRTLACEPCQAPRLTETSYIVLGLLEQVEPATPYDLKQLAQLSTSNFWTVPHTQLYTECARLAAEGLLDERQEEHGPAPAHLPADRARARARSSAGAASRRASSTNCATRRTLKLFFGGDPATLAADAAARRTARGWPSTSSCTRASTRAAARAAARARAAASATSASSSASGRAGASSAARVGLRRRVRPRRARAAAASASGTGPRRAGAAARAAPGPSSSVTKRSRPSTTTTGSRESFARARSASAAAASATASQVARSSMPARVGAPAPVVERLHPGEADRDVELTVAPGAPEAVGDQHADARAGQLAQARADARAPSRRGRAAARSACRASAALEASTPALAQTKPWCVRQISTPRSARSDLGGLVEHDLDARGSRSWPAAAACAASSRARSPGCDVGERDDGALGLRDDLVRDRDELPVAQRLAVAARRRRSARRGRRRRAPRAGRRGRGRGGWPRRRAAQRRVE